MTAQPKQTMTADEFIVWAEAAPGRHELHDGIVVEMQSERAAHVRIKARAYRALERALTASGKSLSCEAMPDGTAVRIDAKTVYEPDALVYCGPRLGPDALEIVNPLLIVEVISPSTGAVDRGEMLAGYFRLPSVQHYVIIDPQRLPIVHHARRDDEMILTRLVNSGPIRLTPPGIEIDVAQLLDL